MNRKRVLSLGVGILLMIAVGAWFVLRSDGVESHQASGGQITNERVSSFPDDVADQLAARLMSNDLAIYKTAWAHEDNIPPMPPAGVKIVASKGSGHADQNYGRFDAIIAISGKGEVKTAVLLQKVAAQWRIYYMEEM